MKQTIWYSCLVLSSVLSLAAHADIVAQPENQVPEKMRGTWKILNYVQSGDPVMDPKPADKLLVGKTFVFSQTALTQAGENKCPGGVSFDELTGDSSARSDRRFRSFLDVELKNILATCKDKNGTNLTVASFQNMQAQYSLISCEATQTQPRKSSDFPLGHIVIDEETMVGKRNDAYYCMKRVLPNATISGAPAATSKAATLNATVAGSNTDFYQYALVNGSGCAGASYSAEFFPTATKITAPLGADGPYTLCVKGKSAVNDMQRVPTQKSWTKDTVPPAEVTLTGTPTNPSMATSLAVKVGGAGVAKYQAALKNGTGCAGVVYKAPVAVATKITFAVGAVGPKTLCVKGIDAFGNVQTTPTQHSWTRQ
jgi:hypothetical protein